MLFLIHILYYYLFKKRDKHIVIVKDKVKNIDIDIDIEYKYKYKLLDKIEPNTKPSNNYKPNKNREVNLEKPVKLYTKDLYYGYKGYRFLSNFPRKWLETIDKFDTIGLNCKNCLYYCCVKTDDEMPLFLGFCSNCFTYFIVNNNKEHSDNDNDCSNCDFCYDRYDCHDCSYCITNVIDYSKEIINVLHNSNGNGNGNGNGNDNKKILDTLILKLNDEYGNLNTTF